MEIPKRSRLRLAVKRFTGTFHLRGLSGAVQLGDSLLFPDCERIGSERGVPSLLLVQYQVIQAEQVYADAVWEVYI